MKLSSTRITAQHVLAQLVGVALLSYNQSVQAASFRPIVELSTLNGWIGFQMKGTGAGDASGRTVSSGGDVNGDGYEDILIGAVGSDPNGPNSGSSYLIFGRADGFPASIDLSALDGNNGVHLDGAEEGDNAGIPRGVGDVNGDGFDDIAIGAPNADPHGVSSGSAFVVFGKRLAFAASLNLSDLDGKSGFRLDGVAAFDRAGSSVAAAGDVNHDGYQDIVVGAPHADPHDTSSGSSYVVFGRGTGFPASISLSTLNGSTGFRLDGTGLHDEVGQSVAGDMDVNGDGFDDLIIGAPGKGSECGGNPAYGCSYYNRGPGASFVVFGKKSGFSATLDMANLNGSNGFVVNGPTDWSLTGVSSSSAGDFNGDGLDDLLIGAPYAINSGASFVVFGRKSSFASAIELGVLDGSDGFRLEGVSSGDMTGISVARAGDINADGFDDIIIGAESASPTALRSGASYVVFGRSKDFSPTFDLATLTGGNGFRLDGVAAQESSGASVSFAGDVNKDGFRDVVIGAPQADPHGSGSGASYAVFGRAPVGSVSREGSAADQYMSGGRFSDVLRGLGGDDSLEGREGPDDLDGGPGHDTASYLHASAGVRASLRSPGSNVGDAIGDRYGSIENLRGSDFNDVLVGDALPNMITGSAGSDIMTGLGGSDRYRFLSVNDSKPGLGSDSITDFSAGTFRTVVDTISLWQIDADTKLDGNQAFSFIGQKPFSGARGQLRVSLSGTSTIVSGDVNGDRRADIEIKLLNFTAISTITAADFEL